MTVDVWVGLGMESGLPMSLLGIGELNLDPQRGACGDVVADVCDGLVVYMEVTVYGLVCWLAIGDWHLELVIGVWEGLKLGMVEMLESWLLWFTIGD